MRESVATRLLYGLLVVSEGFTQGSPVWCDHEIPLGAEGALLWDGSTLHQVEPVAVKAVDTNGAGDMFAGAFLYALSRGETDLRATEYATLAAGEVVKYFGPRLDRDACLALRRQFFGD